MMISNHLNRLGRRGLLLILGGLSWVGIGLSLLGNPRDRFSSPGVGTDSVLQILDSQIFAYMWLVAGVVTLFVGIFRDRTEINNQDAIGFNAFLTPPLAWTLFFAWSFAVYLVTDGQEGQSSSLYAFIIYALISMFIMVIAGWPEPYAPTVVSPAEDERDR